MMPKYFSGIASKSRVIFYTLSYIGVSFIRHQKRCNRKSDIFWPNPKCSKHNGQFLNENLLGFVAYANKTLHKYYKRRWGSFWLRENCDLLSVVHCCWIGYSPCVELSLLASWGFGGSTGRVIISILCSRFFSLTMNVFYRDHLNWIKTLQGLAMGIQCFGGELPFFFLSGWILKKIGHIHAMSLVLSGFGLRFLLYSALTNPWWVLPIELLNGVTFGIFYSTMASYASIVAPPGTEATLQVRNVTINYWEEQGTETFQWNIYSLVDCSKNRNHFGDINFFLPYILVV